MRATYGWPDSVEEYSRIAQTMSYDGERAMFEAYTRNKYTSTGVIQWMLNNAWPSVIWHLYDYYLDAGGGYFGTKEACEPMHVQYSYDDHSVYLVSSLPVAVPSLTVHVEVYDFQLHRLFEQTRTVDVAADDSQSVINIPAGIFQPANSIHFVRLELKKQSGRVVSRNFYWIPTPLTNFDWSDPDTPAKSLENMQALRRLPKSGVRGTSTIMGRELRVHLENPSNALAFQVQLAASSADKKPVTPMLWSDDFIELMPGEYRELTAMLPEKYAGAAPTISVTGWNIDPLVLTPETPH
jgi:exo-1,4-beta-D-glucosaminidase